MGRVYYSFEVGGFAVHVEGDVGAHKPHVESPGAGIGWAVNVAVAEPVFGRLFLLFVGGDGDIERAVGVGGHVAAYGEVAPVGGEDNVGFFGHDFLLSVPVSLG